MEAKEILCSAKEALRHVVLLPFYPIAIGIAFFFGWVISVGSKIPEDLDEQVRLANKGMDEKGCHINISDDE